MARPRAFDETDVLRRARQPFADRGYAATSVEELTAATGLRRSSLYGAFGDKHGLFLRVFDDYCSGAMAAVHEDLAGDDEGALARLEAHLRGKAEDPQAAVRGCLLAKETAELAGDDADVTRMAADAYATYERELVACVTAAQRAGDLRADVDPAAAGTMLLAVLRGIEALGKAGRPAADQVAAGETALALLRA